MAFNQRVRGPINVNSNLEQAEKRFGLRAKTL